MKKLCRIIFVCITTLTGAAHAQSTSTGFISFNAAVTQTAEAQKGFSDLEKKFAPREARVKTMNDEVEGLKKQLQINGDKLTEAERSTRSRALDEKEKQLQREIEDYRNDSQSEAQQVFQAVAKKLYAFLQEYAPQHGYTAVIERGSVENPIVWYAAGNTDITAAVVKAYDAKSGVPAILPNQKKD